MTKRLLFVVNEAFFFLAHRMPAARAAKQLGYEIHLAAPPDHAWAPPDFDVATFADHGIHFHPIPLSRRGTNPFVEMRTVFAINRLCRELDPEIIHGLTIKPILYGGLVARWRHIAGAVFSITGLGKVFSSRGPRIAIIRTLVTFGYRFAFAHRNAAILVENSEDGATLVQLGSCAPEQICVTNGTGVPLDEFVPIPESVTDRPIVVLAARLIWDKGVGEFAEAARILMANGTPCRMVLVGDTKSENTDSVSEADLKSWQAEGILEWWGLRDDMPLVFGMANVVCLPTKYGEGIPRSLIEAAACQRAIVTTNAPGCREIVDDGENGILVPLADGKALATAIEKLVRDPSLRAKMGRKGRAMAEAQFSVESVQSKTLVAYSKIEERGRIRAS
jgi:glycosyltransferase involved in cell wall biosynthesis